MLKNRLADFLYQRRITPYRMAQDLGVSKTTVYYLVNTPEAVPHSQTLKKICEYYGAHPSEILYLDESDLAVKI